MVVARDQIFIGAAISQSSTMGVALALWAGAYVHGHSNTFFHSPTFLSAMAITFSVIAAFITGGGGTAGRESHEAITGWVFLISASFAVLLVSRSPHGLEEVHRLLSSSLIGATETDVLILGVLTIFTVVLNIVFYQKLLLFILDASMATAIGLKMKLWSIITSVWLGLAIGLSIRASGMLYTFGCLILPALISKSLCREIRFMFLVSPAVALGTGWIGFILAHHFDYPPGQMTVALFCIILLIAWMFRRFKAE